MADIYTPADKATYLLMTPFYMPADTGERWAISFSSNGGTVVAAAISVGIMISFLCLWDLVCVAALVFDGKGTRRRFVGLVTIWNSNDPWFAFLHMITYSLRLPSGSNSDWGDTWFGFAIAAAAFLVFGASVALGIVGPSFLQIGTVAPVRPSTLFYPAAGVTMLERIQRFGLQAPGAMRALGSVEAAGVTIVDRVEIDQIRPDGPLMEPDDETNVGFTYRYSLTGVDFGLQYAPHLTLTVEGSCITEYGWRVGDTPEGELYHLWNNPELGVRIPHNDSDIKLAPRVSFRMNPTVTEDDKALFAVIVASAHRASVTHGTDPWYLTEQRPENAINLTIPADFWMKLGRPVLSCWQQDTWSHGGQQVYSSGLIRHLPGLALKDSLLGVLEVAFTRPMVFTLGNAGGDSALRSRTTSPNGVIDAAQSSIMSDMTRLILASYVASRNVFADATMYGKPGFIYPDLLRPNDQLADGAADFVISDPDIQTFSLAGIVALAVLLGILLVVVSVISLVARYHSVQHDEVSELQNSRSPWTRMEALSAAHLFRAVYEPEELGPFQNFAKHWPCKGLPDYGDTELATCSNTCGGHIHRRGKLAYNTLSEDDNGRRSEQVVDTKNLAVSYNRPTTP
ncbi:hypothetical protein DL765_003922 [Monosporascus sp. GIB2]|nr:hypothetical protein DL765_003922 [Monosporascus sp. GIB2]